MPFLGIDHKVFRRRASRVRALADAIHDDLVAKAQMREIAASYERMADRVEARHRAIEEAQTPN